MQGGRASRMFFGAMIGVPTGASALTSAYLGVLTVAALAPSRGPQTRSTQATRFVVLIPAHDEEAVIARTLRSLLAIDYPADKFAVHVVADHCTDATAEIVRAHGFAVHERSHPDPPGKGPALNWLLDQVRDEPFDAVVVVDADTVVDAGVLTAFDEAFRDGAAVAQGHYTVLEPERSVATSFRYAALSCRHHLRSLGRNRIGASAGLFGNGMAFRREVLERHPWSGHLVEDAELQAKLLLRDGMLVTYVPEAVVRAEMPATNAGAASQNARWERGRLQVARRLAPRLIGRARRNGPRIALFDTAVDLLVPPLSVIAVLQVLTTSGSAALAAVAPRWGRRLLSTNLVSSALLTAHVLVALRLVDAPTSVYRSLLKAPTTILWKAKLWTRVVGSKEEIQWVRTSRNDQI